MVATGFDSFTKVHPGETPFLTLAAQPAITCSKLTIETLEQSVKYVQS